MNEIIHGYVVSVILTKFRINANIQLWQSFSILNFEIGIVSDFLQYINLCLHAIYFLFFYFQAEEFAGAPLMCQAAGEWHLVGVSSWRKSCSSVGQRPRLFDRVSVNSEWAQTTIFTLEVESEENNSIENISKS